MAITISPADGFISRLQMQTQHSVSRTSTAKHSDSTATIPDQVSISDEARQATHAKDNHQLESKLMDMYNQRGNSTI